MYVNMKIYEVKERTEIVDGTAFKGVGRVGEGTHHQFLSEKEIEKIKEYVPQALAVYRAWLLRSMVQVSQLHLWGRRPRLEMCCPFPKELEEKALENNCFLYGIQNYGIEELTVNEQILRQLAFMSISGLRNIQKDRYG